MNLARHALPFCALRLAALAGALVATPALAGTVELSATQPLDFGAFVVLGSGTKQIAPDGSVTASGLAKVAGPREGPASFNLRYAPDGPRRSAVILISISTASPQTRNGSTGTLTSFATDLPGVPLLTLGETRMITLPRCQSVACNIAFRVGGRLSVSGSGAATSFNFPLQVTVRLLAETA